MEINLTQDISDATIINGFPGFGLVATIATEYLIEHMKGEIIGTYWFEDQTPSIAIHEGKKIYPITLFYSKDFHVVIIHGMSNINGIEFEVADFVKKVAEKVGAKEIISLEGIGSNKTENNVEESQIYYYASNDDKKKIFEEKGLKELKEGIILGVTAAIMLKVSTPLSCIFAETHSQLPDSKAAAQLIEVLDKYLGLNVEVQPLLEMAEKFEGKLKSIMEKTKVAKGVKEKKDLSYVG
jgi:uncharacterized protein